MCLSVCVCVSICICVLFVCVNVHMCFCACVNMSLCFCVCVQRICHFALVWRGSGTLSTEVLAELNDLNPTPCIAQIINWRIGDQSSMLRSPRYTVTLCVCICVFLCLCECVCVSWVVSLNKSCIWSSNAAKEIWASSSHVIGGCLRNTSTPLQHPAWSSRCKIISPDHPAWSSRSRLIIERCKMHPRTHNLGTGSSLAIFVFFLATLMLSKCSEGWEGYKVEYSNMWFSVAALNVVQVLLRVKIANLYHLQ